MNKLIDALLILGLLIAIGFFVYVERGSENGIQVFQPPARTATNTSLYVRPATTPVLSSFVPGVSLPTSVLVPTSTFTPFPTATLKLTVTPVPTSNPTKTSAATSFPTQVPVEEEIRQGIEQGTQVVQAIESYSQTQGFYPPTLNDLVPNYLPAFPLTGTGQPFFYRVFDRTTAMSAEIYWVAFKVTSQDHVTCTYFRRLQYWDCNFNSP